MQLRLTYEGILLGASRDNKRARHKHDLRKVFHKQLMRFWDLNPDLRSASIQDHRYMHQHHAMVPYLERKFARHGYNFVPLVAKEWTLNCSVSILMLRPDLPGTLIRSGDLDNRLKTIFDALRMPDTVDELGGYDIPGDDEKPFYCLLEDDKLVTHVSIETDILLETVSDPPNKNDTRLIIKVVLRPQRSTMFGLLFN